MSNLIARLRARLRYRRFDRDVAEELRLHQTMAEQDLQRAGASPADARTDARRALGNQLVAREEVRTVWIAPALEHVVQDVRLAGRQLRRSPIFAVTAVVISALGIGALTAVFSLVNAVLLQPPPYPEPERILALSTAGGAGVDGVTFHAVRNRARAIGLTAAQGSGAGWNLTARTHAEFVIGQRVSRDLFGVLGVAPLMGRAFSEAEDTAGGPEAVVLSHAVWQRALDGRPDAIGQVIQLGGTPHAVVGVMPEGFRTVPPADIWTPLRLSERDNSVNYSVLMRLSPGVSPQNAAAVLELAKADVMAQQPEPAHARTRSLSWMELQQRAGAERTAPLLILLFAVGAVVLVACANLAGLQLLRTMARGHEVATRIALGGGAGRIVQQLLTESGVLAVMGGAIGITVAWLLMPSLARLLPPELLMGQTPTLDSTVLGVSLASTMAVGLLFGLAPALGALRVDLRSAMSDGARHSVSRGRAWWRRGLMAGELAATMALLVIASLLGQTLLHMYDAELGFDPAGVSVGKTSFQGEAFADPQDVNGIVRRALTAISQQPGVVSAAVANHVPVERGINLPLEPPANSQVSQVRAVDWRYVTSEYFELLRIGVRTGSVFDDGDQTGGAPVAVVNETFARTYFGDAGAVGRTISLVPQLHDTPREVVGVVADVRSRPGAGWTRGLSALGADVSPIMYVPLSQVPADVLTTIHRFFPASWIVRTSGPVPDLDRRIEQSIRGVEPSLALVRVVPMTEIIAEDIWLPQVLATAIAAFAIVALIVACTGIYGLVAYATSQRAREIAIRLALGASRGSLVRLFVWEGIWVAAIGVVLGLGATAGLSNLLIVFLSGTGPLDPIALAAAAAVLTAALGVAVMVPALRASRTDPVDALRVE